MYKSRLIYAAVILASFVFSQALYESVSFMTFVIALLLPVLSVTLALISYPLISVKVNTSGTRFARLMKFVMRITVRNKSPFISPSFKITCSVPDESGKKTEQVVFVFNSSFARKNSFDYDYFFANRGIYTISVDKVEYYDFLKLIKIRKSVNKKINIISEPRNIELMLPVGAEQQNQDNSNLVGTAAVVNGGDMIGVREYAFGDNLKNVHWKLSAKNDDLVVKSFAEDIYDQAYVIADMSVYYEDLYLNKSITDCVVEATLSAIRDYAKNSIRFSLIINTAKGETVRYPISTPVELFEAEKAISRSTMVDDSDILDMLKNINFGTISGCEVCIITSFRSEDVLKSIQKMFIDKKTRLQIINVSENEQNFKTGVITYTREYIEKQGGKR